MIFETYVQRKRKAAKSGGPDVYEYDDVPEELRHQINMTLREGIGRFHRYTGGEIYTVREANNVWKEIDRICRKEIFSYAREPLVRRPRCILRGAPSPTRLWTIGGGKSREEWT